MSTSSGVLLTMLPAVLTTLVKVAGLVCAFILMRQDRRAAGFALAGFAVLVVDNIVNSVWVFYLVTQGPPVGGSTPVLVGVGLCQELLFVVGCVLVIIAFRMRIAGPRPTTAPPTPPWTAPPVTDAQPGSWGAPPAPDAAGAWPASAAPDAHSAPGGWPAPQASDAPSAPGGWPAPSPSDAPPAPEAPPAPGGWTPPGQGTDANSSGSSPGSGMSSSSG